MKISSTAFKENDSIPKKFTSDDANVSPPLHFEDVPNRAKSLALVVEDPDAPSGTFHHWVLFNMSPRTTDIHENSVPVMATQGKNDFGQLEYGGPKPPSGEHHYIFNVYALDTVLSIPRGADSKMLASEMNGHIMDKASLTGRYARK
jgi:Raf kinase inhibitor-like YbhB/YbcL family protein